MYLIKTQRGNGMYMLNRYIDQAENEALFQKALAEKDYDKMWECVYLACVNITKRIYANRGFIAQEDDLYDVSMNGCCMCMRNILERGAKPEKLSSYCYFRCFAYVQGYKQDKFSRKLKDVISNNKDVSYYLNEEIYDE